MVVPMVGLAYWPLVLWLPVLAMQAAATMCAGRGLQGAIRSLTSLLVDTPLLYFLKIVWVVMLVLSLECVRNVFMVSSPAGDGGAVGLSQTTFQIAAAKEGALVLVLNLVVMVAILVVHSLNGEAVKLERDRDMMKRQAEQQSAFTKSLLESDEKKKDATAGVPKETKMPEGEKPDTSETELRKRD
mmetsp:Transcript_62021/g.108601  ORF Transcript_62021/g.108601 Transcript_62021/m.108601 type:complete len:186 (-) Transcript_62021:117-674(-)